MVRVPRRSAARPDATLDRLIAAQNFMFKVQYGDNIVVPADHELEYMPQEKVWVDYRIVAFAQRLPNKSDFCMRIFAYDKGNIDRPVYTIITTSP